MIKNILIISSLAALTTLAACGDDGKDSGDTSTTGTGTTTGTTSTGTTGTGTTPDLAIDLVEYPSCAGDTLTYYAETIAWTDGNNIVNAWETDSPDGWNDEHTMPSIDFDEFGGWDVLQRDLGTGAAAASWTPDVDTVFSCAIATSDAMTFAIRVYDLDGNLGDCAMFSGHATGIDDVLGGMAPTYTPVSAENEISATNCAEWTVAR